ncbi:MAG TPA: hypothetical protein VHY09_09520 [Candidatus Methylacidiphilales bacterium]|jgi:hypothetical protein|nr:hypothetical protein [Candidatus Methylacidiphilales bacterium]
MNLALPAALLISSGNLSSRGVSPAAEFVMRETESGRAQLQSSYSLGQLGKGTFHELLEVARDRSFPNWDGYGAEPVPHEAYLAAFAFLEALPLGSPAPSVGAEPDGHVTLEWYHSPRQVLSVSISPDCELNYAALLPGPRKASGKEQFVGDVPQAILALISDVIPDAPQQEGAVA